MAWSIPNSQPFWPVTLNRTPRGDVRTRRDARAGAPTPHWTPRIATAWSDGPVLGSADDVDAGSAEGLTFGSSDAVTPGPPDGGPDVRGAGAVCDEAAGPVAAAQAPAGPAARMSDPRVRIMPGGPRWSGYAAGAAASPLPTARRLTGSALR